MVEFLKRTVGSYGEVTLEETETDHEITVQAEDGTIKVYSVRIRKNMYLMNWIILKLVL